MQANNDVGELGASVNICCVSSLGFMELSERDQGLACLSRVWNSGACDWMLCMTVFGLKWFYSSWSETLKQETLDHEYGLQWPLGSRWVPNKFGLFAPQITLLTRARLFAVVFGSSNWNPIGLTSLSSGAMCLDHNPNLLCFRAFWNFSHLHSLWQAVPDGDDPEPSRASGSCRCLEGGGWRNE